MQTYSTDTIGVLKLIPACYKFVIFLNSTDTIGVLKRFNKAFLYLGLFKFYRYNWSIETFVYFQTVHQIK